MNRGPRGQRALPQPHRAPQAVGPVMSRASTGLVALGKACRDELAT